MTKLQVSDLRHALQTLNIVPNQMKYVWLARFYVILPLPDGWERTEPEYNTDTYIHAQTGEKIYVKPCYYYISKVLEILKMNPEYDRIYRAWMKEVEGVLYHVFENGLGKSYLVTNNDLFNHGTTNIIENNQETAKLVVAKEHRHLKKSTNSIIERCNFFMRNQSNPLNNTRSPGQPHI